MKLKLIAAACLTAFAAPAIHALDAATTGAASTVKIFMSGASAQRAALAGVFKDMCVGDAVSTTVSTFTFSSNVVGRSCTIKAGIPGLAGKNVFLAYNSDGGSGNGVYPIAKLVNASDSFTNDNNNKRPQIVDPAACTGTNPNYTCATATLGDRWSDAGVSDVEPAMFKFLVNRPSNFASVELEDFELGNLDVGSQNQVIMGIAANTVLYNDLAAAQGVSVPSLPRSFVISMLAGNLSQPQQGNGWQVLFTNSLIPMPATASLQVNIGRRVNGSGTQAAANAYFLGYGCNPTAGVGPADDTANSLVSTGNPTDDFEVNLGSGTDQVKEFLTLKNNLAAPQYAIGLISKENDPSVDTAARNQWKHVAIDGVQPSRDNAKLGLYDYVVEQTMQWNTKYLDLWRTETVLNGGAGYALPAGVTVQNLKDFLGSFRTRSGAPQVLDTLNATTKQGVAAMINETEGYIFNDPSLVAPGPANKTFVSRMTKSGNTCQPFLWNK